jgi:N-acetylglucosaminyl-diphospho-decaprenol L-rhamnosyltransferase
MTTRLDIVIVNWNSGGYLRPCLDSIHSTSRAGFEIDRVVVVDNASADGSADGLHFPELPLVLVRNTENRGFSAACNQAVAGSQADYVLFLNPDTILFADSLTAPVGFMEKPESSKVGICGIQLVDEEGHVLKSCSTFPTPGVFCGRMLGLDKLFPRLVAPQMILPTIDGRSEYEVDHVTGALIVVRRRVFEELGSFDERFFVYLDDLDLSLRFVQHGYSSYYLTTTRACHGEGKCARYAKASALFYLLRSRILYAWKHFGTLGALSVLICTVGVEPFTRIARAIGRGSFKELRETLGAYGRLWRETPRLWLQRG